MLLVVALLLFDGKAALKIFAMSLSEGDATPYGFSHIHAPIDGISPSSLVEVDQAEKASFIVTNIVAENLYYFYRKGSVNWLDPAVAKAALTDSQKDLLTLINDSKLTNKSSIFSLSALYNRSLV